MQKNLSLTITMKWLVCLILMLGVVAARATDVFINLAELGANPATNRIVTWQQQTPFLGNLFYTNTGSTNGFWQSNVPPGVLFNYRVTGPPAPIPFQIYVPSAGMGGLDMSNFTSAGSASTFPAGAVAPSWQAAFSLFALNGNVQSNLFYPLNSNPSNYTAQSTVTNIVLALASTNSGVAAPTVTNIAAAQAQLATNSTAIVKTNNPQFVLALTNAAAFDVAGTGVTNAQAATNGLPAGVWTLGSISGRGSNDFYLNSNPSNYQSGAQVAISIGASNANYVTLTIFTTTTNYIATNGMTNLIITSNALALATINATNAAVSNLLAWLQGTNTVLLGAIASSTNPANLASGIQAVIGSVFNTNQIYIYRAYDGSLVQEYFWSGSKYTNANNNPYATYITNSFAGNGVWTIFDGGGGDILTNTQPYTSQGVIGSYNSQYTVGLYASINWYGLTLTAYQPASPVLTNLSKIQFSWINTNAYSGAGGIVLITNSGNNVIISNTASGGAVGSFITTTNGAGTNTTLVTSPSIQATNYSMNQMPLFTYGGSQIIGVDYGGDQFGANNTYVQASSTLWTNCQYPVYTILLTSGNYYVQSNSTSEYESTNGISGNWFTVSGPAPAPQAWFGATNEMSGSYISGAPLWPWLNNLLNSIQASVASSNLFVQRFNGSALNLSVSNTLIIYNTNISGYSVSKVTLSGYNSNQLNTTYIIDLNPNDPTYGWLTNIYGNVVVPFYPTMAGTIGGQQNATNLSAYPYCAATVSGGSISADNGTYTWNGNYSPVPYYAVLTNANGAAIAAQSVTAFSCQIYIQDDYYNNFTTQYPVNGSNYVFSTLRGGSAPTVTFYYTNAPPSGYIPYAANDFPAPPYSVINGYLVLQKNNATNFTIVSADPNTSSNSLAWYTTNSQWTISICNGAPLQFGTPYGFVFPGSSSCVTITNNITHSVIGCGGCATYTRKLD